MEALKALVQKVLESPVWKSFFGHLQWIDWLAAAAVLTGFFGGLKKGFTRAFLETITWVLTAALTLEFYPQTAVFLQPHLDFLSGVLLTFTAFVLLASACLLALRLFFWGFVFILPAADASAVELSLAIAFNIFNKLLFLGLAGSAILLSPWGGLKPVFGSGDSYAGYALVQLVVRIHASFAGPLAGLRAFLHL